MDAESIIGDPKNLQYQNRLFSFLFNKNVPHLTYEDERRPFDLKNILARLFFTWVQPLLKIGYKRTILPEDLYYLTDDIKVNTLFDIFMQHNKEQSRKDEIKYVKKKCKARNESLNSSSVSFEDDLKDYKYSAGTLFKSLFLTFKWQVIFAIVCLILGNCGFSLLALVSRHLILFVSLQLIGEVSNVGPGIGYSLGCALIVGVSFLLFNQYMYFMMLTGSAVKGILTKFILLKAYKADATAKHEYPASKITTLMSTDLAKILFATHISPFLTGVIGPIIISIVLLAVNLGYPAAVGIVIVFVLGAIIVGMGTIMIRIRKKSLQFTDSRVNYIKEVINNLKIIKYYSWETAYFDNISSIRRTESRHIFHLEVFKNLLISLAVAVSPLASMAAFLVLNAAASDNRTAANIFSSVTLFSTLGNLMIDIPFSLGAAFDGMVSLKRVAAFVGSSELDPQQFIDFKVDAFPSATDSDQTVIKLSNASFEWDKFDAIEEPDEKETSKKKKEKEKEKEKEKKKKKNKKYPKTSSSENQEETPEKQVINDFPGLNNINLNIKKGEFIIVTGSIGSGKSSFLSALSGFMRKKSGEACVNGDLILCGLPWIQNSTVKENILFGKEFDQKFYDEVVFSCSLNSDLDILPGGENTEVGERGITLSGGQKARISLARGVYGERNIILLDDVLSAVDAKVGKHIMNSCILGLLKEKTRILVTHQLSFIKFADRIVFLNGDGTIDVGTFDELKQRNENFVKLTSFSDKETRQEDKKELVTANGFLPQTEKPNNYDSEKVEQEEYEGNNTEYNQIQSKEEAQGNGKLIDDEERAVNSISFEVYKNFVTLGSNKLNPIIFICFIVCMASMSTFNQLFTNTWLSFWTEYRFGVKTDGFYMGLYAMFTVLSLLFMFTEFSCYVYLSIGASRNLNIKAMKNLLHAPMSYMDTNPVGRIINRFTRDTDALDNEVGELMKLVAFSTCFIIGTFILNIIYLPWVAIAVPLIIILFLFVGSYYQASGREVKRLEAIQRSFVFNNFNESLGGMETIKTFGEVDRFIERNDYYMNKTNEADYMVNAVQRWLSIQLVWLSFFFVLLISLLAVNRVFNISAASTGLVISSTFTIPNILSMLIRTYTELENQMNSVERLSEFAFRLPQEAPYMITETSPPPQWPQQGRITFANVSMRYREGLPNSIKNINLNIKPMEKIGICGRTGAGKSSLTSAIYRLCELSQGKIMIDDIDISSLGLHQLRSKMSIIPQESVLFRGTIRSNLDPFKQASDDILWKALHTTGLIDDALWNNLKTGKSENTSTSSQKFHLDSMVIDDGSNFSLGERQLISFARAIVRNSKILVLDEATSSVDYATDSAIQHTLRNAFKECTIMCIAHRLRTIISYDKILVLDQGEIKEFDTPWNLFSDHNSIFHQLCERSNITADEFVN